MKISRKIAAVLVCTIAVAAPAGDSRADKQKKIRKMAQDTLQRLYAAKPSARSAVQGAAGLAAEITIKTSKYSKDDELN